MSVECVHATPSVPAKGGSKAVPAHFDIVLVRAADVNENQHTKGTYLKGALLIDYLLVFQSSNQNKFNRTQIRAIFTLPGHLQHAHLPNTLAYIEWFTPFRAPHPNLGLFPVTRASRNNGPVSDIIPLDAIISSCHLIPRFGMNFHPTKWNSNILEECKSFFLNKYLTIRSFYNLSSIYMFRNCISMFKFRSVNLSF